MIAHLAKEEARAIIDSRMPVGTFYTVDDETVVGIDNTTGDAWTEESKTLMHVRDG